LIAMSTAVRALRPRELVLALALVGVVAGLVGMHHVLAAGTHAAPMPGDAPAAAVVHRAAPAPGAEAATTAPRQGGHGEHDGFGADLLHLCLAVLVTGAALVIALAVVRGGEVVPVLRARSTGARATSPRAPPLPVPRRLALLCVLRT
jgi:hypothetical protein